MTWQDIKKLRHESGYPSITILVPTNRNMPERLQDPIRIKNLIKEVTDRLLGEFEKNTVLPIIRSLDHLADNIDYTLVKDGLAFFVNDKFAQVYNLPFKVNQKIAIDKKFALKDIITLLIKHPTYWVLSISHKPARLFLGTDDYIDEIIDPKELQDNMQGFPYHLNYEVTGDREQFAYATGDRDCGYKTELDKKFMHDLDKIFDKHFSNNQLPIIILGTQKNRAYFEETTKHKKWIIGQHEGDYTKTPINQIAQIANKLMNEYHALESAKDIEKYIEAVGKLKHAYGVQDVWHKALEGRIHVLLIEDDLVIPGAINPDFPDQIIFYDDLSTPGSYDVIDDIIEKTIETDAKIVFVKPGSLKDYQKIAAILRY